MHDDDGSQHRVASNDLTIVGVGFELANGEVAGGALLEDGTAKAGPAVEAIGAVGVARRAAGEATETRGAVGGGENLVDMERAFRDEGSGRRLVGVLGECGDSIGEPAFVGLLSGEKGREEGIGGVRRRRRGRCGNRGGKGRRERLWRRRLLRHRRRR